uniref:Uncharacterized protein n=1 Tax=Arundo donax TaxID=35708 RepID=A0A0A9D6E1_ARUDO
MNGLLGAIHSLRQTGTHRQRPLRLFALPVPQLRQPARLRLDQPVQRRSLAGHDGEVIVELLHALHGELPHEGAGPGAVPDGRLVDDVEDGLVEDVPVRVVEALDAVRQPELGGQDGLAEHLVPVLDVRGDPLGHEPELLVELGVQQPVVRVKMDGSEVDVRNVGIADEVRTVVIVPVPRVDAHLALRARRAVEPLGADGEQMPLVDRFHVRSHLLHPTLQRVAGRVRGAPGLVHQLPREDGGIVPVFHPCQVVLPCQQRLHPIASIRKLGVICLATDTLHFTRCITVNRHCSATATVKLNQTRERARRMGPSWTLR